MRHFELPGDTKKKTKFYPNSAFLFQKLEIITFQGVESNKQWLLWLYKNQGDIHECSKNKYGRLAF